MQKQFDFVNDVNKTCDDVLALDKNWSKILIFCRLILPVLVNLISYLTISPLPKTPSPLSVTVAVLVASIPGEAVILTTVGSLVVLLSVSSPSSEVSVTSSVFPAEEAVANTVLDVLPAATATCVVVYDAV